MSSTPRARLYTTPWCGYCRSAVRLLEQEGVSFVEHDVAADPALRRQVAAETGWRTVPMVFVDDVFVGGYTELAALRSRGGLGGGEG